MTLNGLPIHPMVVHFAVVMAPLAGLIALAFAFVPRWRWALRWPMAVSAVLAAAGVWFSAFTGSQLKHMDHVTGHLIAVHEMWAGRLQAGCWVLAAAAIAAAIFVPHRSPLGENPNRGKRVLVLSRAMVVVVPVIAALDLWLVYKTGDAGAKSVWAGQ